MIPLGILATTSGGAAAGAYELISSTVLSSSAATVTFSSIDQTYKHLQIRAVGRAASGGAGSLLVSARFNADSGANYAYHDLFGSGSSVVSSSATSSTIMPVLGAVGSAGEANAFGSAVIDILDYASSSKNKTVRSLTGFTQNTTPLHRIYLRSGVWLNTAAITSIQLGDFSGGINLAAGSRISLYGIRG